MNKDMKIIFLGTPEFAVASLQAILNANKKVVAVVTSPDKKAGRGQKMQSSAVKLFAVEKNIPVLQPTNLKDPSFIEELRSFNADLQIVVAFRMLPEQVWDMPKHGTINLHASLLPKYRGAAPINWAIINQEKETGVSTFLLEHKIDTGDILFQEKVLLKENETAGSLHDKLMNIGAQLIVKTIDAVETQSFSPIKQSSVKDDDRNWPLAPKIFREDCKINWNKSVEEIDAFIRGLSPYPGAWTNIRNKSTAVSLTIKIYESRIDSMIASFIGLKLIENRLFVGHGDKCTELLEIQLEGKKRMDVASLLNGMDLSNWEIT